MFRSNVTCKTVGGLMYATLSPYASLWSYSMVPCFSLPAPSDLNFGSFFKHNHVSFLFKAVALGSLIELRLISLGIEPSPPPLNKVTGYQLIYIRSRLYKTENTYLKTIVFFLLLIMRPTHCYNNYPSNTHDPFG